MAAGGELVTRGIVLRETETREADKILTLLTPELGRIPVIARGARRKTCRYAACAQPLAWSEWTLFRRKDWFYADEGASLELFAGLRADFEGLALGFYFAELTEAVTAPEVPAGELVRHLLNGLYALDKLKKPRALAKPAFEWKLMCLAGYEPLADGCAVCGAEEPAEAGLDAVQGVLRCRECGGKGPALPLADEAVAALRHIVYGDPRRLYAFTLSGAALAQLQNAAEAYIAAQLERRFQTLDYYKGLEP